MSFLKDDGKKVTFIGDGELIYYIPEKYFETGAASIIGEFIETIGIFTYAVFDKSGKKVVLKPFKWPTMIRCKYSEMSKEPNYHLEGTSEPMAYRLLHFKKDDELVCDVNIAKDFSNLKLFINLFIRANMPDNIPYDKIHEYVIENANLNNFDYKVSGQIIGMLISEIYRDAKDLSRPFRLSGMNDMLSYKAISIDKVPKYTSAFIAVTSDNADEAIAAAITNGGNGVSPLEKIMMG